MASREMSQGIAGAAGGVARPGRQPAVAAFLQGGARAGSSPWPVRNLPWTSTANVTRSVQAHFLRSLGAQDRGRKARALGCTQQLAGKEPVAH